MSKYILLDFTASWCGPCRIQKPIIEDLKNMTELFEIKVVDVDADPQIANKYNISVVPTLIVEKDGKEIIRYTGITEKEKILSDLKEIDILNL